MMKKSDFYYDLPENLIAQTPIEPRNSSRLLVLSKENGEVSHDNFSNLMEYLKPGDCLVLNNTRVLPARIFGRRKDTGADVEFVLLKQKEQLIWECIAGPGKKAREGHEFIFSDKLSAVVNEVLPDGNRILKFECDGEFYSVLDEVGQMPLPPYIKEKLEDAERYQTVYSKEIGSAAAPTAGLHFTDDMLAVCVNNKYGIINKHLVEVVPIRYDSIGYFRDGVADVRIHNRTGYINKKGEMRVKDGDQEAWIPTKYEWGDDFHEGLAAVLLNYKWGFINRDGEEVIPLVYEEVLAPGFCNGMATVMLNGEWVKIDVNGNVIQE